MKSPAAAEKAPGRRELGAAFLHVGVVGAEVVVRIATAALAEFPSFSDGDGALRLRAPLFTEDGGRAVRRHGRGQAQQRLGHARVIPKNLELDGARASEEMHGLVVADRMQCGREVVRAVAAAARLVGTQILAQASAAPMLSCSAPSLH